MYKVIVAFADLQDGNHVYAEGDAYPRDGYQPDDGRVDALVTGKNLQHKPLIKHVKETAKPQNAAVNDVPKPRRKKADN